MIQNKKTLLTYLNESKKTNNSLAFILPILITYEVGIRIINFNREFYTVNGVDKIIKDALISLGFYGSLLSAICVVLTLIFIHLRKHEKNNAKIGVIGLMLIESIVVALPLFVLDWAVKETILSVGVTKNSGVLETIILSLGAGVYEEFFFRMILLGGGIFVLSKITQKNHSYITILCVIITSLLFAIVHHLGPLGDDFSLKIFAFRTLAGIYFSWIYLTRGFGIAVGCHTAYDLMVVGLKLWQILGNMN